jgi:outer membrane protein assembly factor BamB
VCVNALTGHKEWAFPTGGVEALAPPVITGPPGERVVAVTTLAGAFDILSLSTGKLLYQFQTPGFSASSFADMNGNLVVAAADGYLYDFAPSGGNGTAPVTAVTSPQNGQAVPNPGGSQTVSGTAAGTSIASVEVAIESGGPVGPWWDAAAGTWTSGFFDNPATLADPGSASTTWSLDLPVPLAGGTYHVLASAAQGNGVADVSDLSPEPGASNINFSIGNAPGTPALTVVGSQWIAPGSVASVNGSGFASGETVSFSLDGKLVGSAVATSSGQVAATQVTVPKSAGFGPTDVIATGKKTGDSATAQIDVSNNWSQSGYDSTHTNSEPNDNVLANYVAPGPPQFLSSVWSLVLNGSVRTSAAVAQDVAFVGDDSGTLTAVQVRDGQPLWSATVLSAIDSSPALSGSLVFFGTMGGSVVALNQSNGTPAWSVAASSAVESSPALAGGSLYVGSDDGTVYDLNQANGAVTWHTKVGGAVKGSPAVDTTSGTVVVGDSSGKITALSATTGAVLWTATTGGAVTATPSIYQATVYVGSGDGSVYALSESAGTPVWTYSTGSPIAAAGVVYSRVSTPTDYVVGSQNGNITYLFLTTGTLDAQNMIGGAVVGLGGSPGWVAATTANGLVFGLKQRGALVWAGSDNATFVAAPTVVNGVVYTAGTDQALTAYTPPGRPIP